MSEENHVSEEAPMPAGRGWAIRILQGVLVAVLVLPLLIWLGFSAAAKLSTLQDMPIRDVLALVGEGLVSTAVCSVTGCEAELLEGMESRTFDEVLLTGTPVALDVDEQGRVLVAESGRQGKGAEDNREHPYWLEDDLASRTVEDRRAYYRKWIEAGEIEDPNRFTAETDRLVLLEDEDGDGKADRRSELASWNDMASGLVAGVEARGDEIFVTAIPSIYRVDRSGGGASQVEELHTGFGVKTSLVGHDLHGLAWGPDGRIYFSMGDRGYHVEAQAGEVLEPSMGPGRGAIFRMNPDGSELEVFATGVRNPQELAFDDFGNLFTGDNNGDGGDAARIVYLVEGGETGWAMPYQTLAGDYVRGPWMAERLWDLQHATQPAWVLPPVGHIANGPAGFMHYPGLGLPERYADHFFLCDYGYMPSRSGIWSFAVEPKGAGFEVKDRHTFAWSVLATDFDFSWDGRIFASVFDQIGLAQKIVEWQHVASRADPRVAQLTDWAQVDLEKKETPELIDLLAFPDQRLRLRAQYALAESVATEALVALSRNREATLLPRLHALWALGQIGAEGIRALAPEDLAWASEEEDEFRAQLLKVVGEAEATWLVPALRKSLSDPSLRVRFFAAQSLGRIGDVDSIDALMEVLRANQDADVFLRHAATWALHRMNAVDAVWAYQGDPSRSVRLAVLLVLRQAGDARIARFLGDSDPLLSVEAARAIYDWPISSAMPALAALLDEVSPAVEGDTQTSQALHRRVIGANVRLRSELGAARLARYVEDAGQLKALRSLALEALGAYSEPPTRDLTMGFHRPLEAASPEILATVFRAHGRSLAASDLADRVVEIGNAIGESPLDDAELLAWIEDPGTEASRKVSAFGALRGRAEAGLGSVTLLESAIEKGLAANQPEVRSAARDLLLTTDATSGVAELIRATQASPDAAEQQHAWARLGSLRSGVAKPAIEGAVAAYEAGTLNPAVALEVLEAARAQSGAEVAGRAEALLLPTIDAQTSAPDEVVESRRWALAGGDVQAGREVFLTYGDCQRCHGGGGHGAGVGPALGGVGKRGAAHVLESLLVPSAEIAEGYGSVEIERVDGTKVVGLLVASTEEGVQVDPGGSNRIFIDRSEIARESVASTGMPPMGLGLPPRALRDVVAYVMTLE